jgi:hypothetical protein
MSHSSAFVRFQRLDVTRGIHPGGVRRLIVHSQWTATVKSASYRVDAPVVNPVIVPKLASVPL